MSLEMIKKMMMILAVSIIPMSAMAQEEEAPSSQTATEADSADTNADTEVVAEETAPIVEEEPLPYEASCQAGFDLSEGNTSTRNVTLGCGGNYVTGDFKLSLKGDWGYGISRYSRPRGPFIKNRNNWSASLREDYLLDDDQRMYLFFIEGFTGDEFKGLEWDFSGDLGFGYAYVKNDKQTHKAELGFRTQYENFTVATPSEWIYSLTVSLIGNMIISDSASANYKLTYAPNLLDFAGDINLDAEAGLTFKLSDRLAYSAGIVWAYTNNPNLVTALDANGQPYNSGATWQAKSSDITFSNMLVLSVF